VHAVQQRRAALKATSIRRLRWQFGKTLLLFITDRCPVGCAHCSTGSLSRSPSIRDWHLFGEILRGLAQIRDLEVVGISGGEPFVERRGLTMAAQEMRAAGKHVVVYTSGVWAEREPIPDWIDDVLGMCSAVYLSTDMYHREKISKAAFAAAARAIVARGARLVVPVIGASGEVEQARALLALALGSKWPSAAEIEVNPSLTYGRGGQVFAKPLSRAATAFGRCDLVTSPTLRYDGQLVPCCNEEVVLGAGPSRLHETVVTAGDVARILERFSVDVVFRLMSSVGLGLLTGHQRFSDLKRRKFRTICDLCWAIQERQSASGDQENRALALLATIAPAEPPADLGRVVDMTRPL
jgi:hypothetical protein